MHFSIKTKRAITLLLTIGVVAVLFVPFFVWGQSDPFGTQFGTGLGLGTRDIRATIVNIIRVALGILGVLTLVIIIYAGYVWMTAGGNQENARRAKTILVNAVIGLVIIILAAAITEFIFRQISIATSGGEDNGCTAYNQCISSCTFCNASGQREFNQNCAPCSITANPFRLEEVQTASGSSDSKQDVYLCSNVQPRFNNKVDSSAVSGNATLHNYLTGTLVPGSWETRGNSIQFSPDDNFSPSTRYEVRLTTALLDQSGDALADCAIGECETFPPPFFGWQFETGTDTDDVAPMVVSAYPALPSDPSYPNRIVSRAPSLSVTFNEDIDFFSVADRSSPPRPLSDVFVLEKISGPSGGVEQIVDNNNWEISLKEKGFRIKPISPFLLDAFSWYRITLREVRDLCSNAMQPPPVVWEFQTNDNVPGIQSAYPTGDNVCSDSIISFTFGTPMYGERIVFDFDGSTVSLTPTETDVLTTIPAGTLTVKDPVLPVDNNFRLFEFEPSGPLQVGRTYNLSIYAPDFVINMAGDTLAYSWSFTVADAATCACAPYISKLNPSQGPPGQCLTVSGYCFAGTLENSAQISSLMFDSVSGIVGGQGDTYLTSSVPASFSQGDRPLVSVELTYDDSSLGTAWSNEVPFFVDTNDAYTGPCLYDISPAQGCYGTDIGLTGERFGAAAGAVNFSVSGNVPAGDIVSWGDSEISFSLPAGFGDSDVSVIDISGQRSNALPFDVACGQGSACSSVTNLCSPDDSICADGFQCSTACICEPIVPPDAFRVIDSGPACVESCINSALWADFSQDPENVVSDDIELRLCDSNDCSQNVDLGNNFLIDHDLWRISFFTDEGLQVSSTYRAVIKESLQTLDGGQNLSGLNFDSDGDGINDSYSWTFTTGYSPCGVERVDVSPAEKILTARGATQEYIGYVFGSTATCGSQQLDPNDFSWNWYSSQPQAVVVTNDGTPQQEATVQPSANDGDVALITAETEGVSDSGQLTVSLLSCENDSDCASCGGSTCDETTKLCNPVITALAPNSGPPGRWTTVQGCYFESTKGSGKVLFDETTEAVYNVCGSGSWNNNEIIVEVPELENRGYEVTVVTDSGLTSNSSSFGVSEQCVVGVEVPATGVPGVCRTRPTAGQVGEGVSIYGKNFGTDVAGTSIDFNATAADVVSQTDSEISTTVPTGATTGPLTVSVDACPANSVNFEVLSGGIGSSCDADSATPACEVNSNCAANLVCDISAGCTCQPPAPPEVVSIDPPSGVVECRNAAFKIVFSQPIKTNNLSETVTLSELGADTNSIPLSFRTSLVANGQDGCGWEDGCSVVLATASSLLPSGDLVLSVKGDIESVYNVSKGSDSDFAYQIGDAVCSLDRVSMFPPRWLFTTDQPPENAQDFVAVAYTYQAGGIPLSPVPGYNWTWAWSEDDADDFISITSNENQLTATVGKRGQGYAYVTAQAEVMEDIFNTPSQVGRTASATAEIEIFVCDYPWPDPAPYTIGTYSAEMKYCRGMEGENLLPSLVSETDVGTGDALIDNIFIVDGTESNIAGPDIIGLRVFANPTHASAEGWYQSRNFPQGNPSSSSIDGYGAVIDGRSTYVHFVDINSGSAESYILVLSYNQDATADTLEIYRRLLNGLLFNRGETLTEKQMIQEDLERVSGMGTVASLVKKYREQNGQLPDLSSGTFISGQSTSRWPSWQAVLGNALGKRLPQDPDNNFKDCPADYDPASCFNVNKSPSFLCEEGSHIYIYENGTVYGNLKYKGIDWGDGTSSDDSCRSFSISSD